MIKSRAFADPLRQPPSGRQVIPQKDPRGNTLYWIGPPGGKCDAGPGTDFAAVDEGYVSITPLHVDLTAHSAQDVVSDWLNSVGVGTQW